MIDTGSYEMWTTPTCANSAATAYCKSLGLYDPSKSLTAHRINGYYNVTYGSGTVNASYYIDQMTFASAFCLSRFHKTCIGAANADCCRRAAVPGKVRGRDADDACVVGARRSRIRISLHNRLQEHRGPAGAGQLDQRARLQHRCWVAGC
jgi:hypothetical protein